MLRQIIKVEIEHTANERTEMKKQKNMIKYVWMWSSLCPVCD